MSQSDEYENYFQADHSVETQRRRAEKSSNARGGPVRVNKVSALVLDPSNASASHVFVSEATGTIRRVDLDTKKSEIVLSGPAAPLTSLVAVRTPSGTASIVFAGCWDKNIYSTTVEGGNSRSPRAFRGAHTDFVKCLAVYPTEPPLLISGSADRSLAVWDSSTGKLLLQVKNRHKTSPTALLLDPIEPNDGVQFSVFSADSSGAIEYTSFSTTGSGADIAVTLTSQKSLPTPHETTIYSLALVGDDDDLLTASADGSIAVLSRYRNWEPETRLQHGGHVRCAAALEDGRMLITGGRDENVKVWDLVEEKLLATIDGHFDEVMAVSQLRVVMGQPASLASAGLDGTVRKWNLEYELKRPEGTPAKKQEAVTMTTKTDGPRLTAAEEAELAELMDDEDD